MTLHDLKTAVALVVVILVILAAGWRVATPRTAHVPAAGAGAPVRAAR
jgi:hypothetical protein